ncbi:MAG: PrsW family intramembrane metalloprotease [Bacilli bacterium]|nr:PrsW family intramembrane metalloprotease [Bacilli bacterium]
MNLLNYISIIGLSLFTTIIFIILILYSDRKSKEPTYIIFLCLISCIFTICLSLLFGQVLLPKLDIISIGLFDYNTNNIFKILILALVEEYSKLIVLYLFLSKNSNFDDIYDGFVYSSLIALSFAALESLIYVFNEPNIQSMKSLAILRGITTVPLHLICGISMGYFMGKEKFTWGTKRRVLNLMLCLLFPTFLHFIYNFTLSNIINRFLNSNLLILIIILFFIPFYLIGIIFINKTKFLNEKFLNNKHYKNLMTKDEYIKISNK